MLAESLAGHGFEAVSLHPGVCRTKLLEAGFPPGSQGAPPEHCGRTEAHLATAAELEAGAYYEQGVLAQPSRISRDPDTVRRWCRTLQTFG